MVRGIRGGLLGSAAVLIAVTGAQAADLPVKAAPVEYVKVCPTYGAGFYYIPGTDICLRVGGYLRADYYVHNVGGSPNIWNGYVGSDLIYNRNDNGSSFRGRGAVILDARTNTAYGTLRSYFAGGVTYTTTAGGSGGSGSGTNLDRAFIQFAGFTFGYTQSFFDSITPYSYLGVAGVSSRWTALAAYTAQFGNGVSATLSIEDPKPRRGEVTDAKYGGNWSIIEEISNGGIVNETIYTPGTVTNDDIGGTYIPDIVANIRVDQAWGSAQVSGALHQVRPGNQITWGPGSTYDDEWGWAVGGAIEWKVDQIAPGDRFSLHAGYAKGAYEYLGGMGNGPVAPVKGVGHRSSSGVGPVGDLFDAYLAPNGDTELSTAWSVAGQFRHFWTPTLRTNFGVGYFNFEPGAAAASCGPNCDFGGGYPDVQLLQAEVNTIWSPVANLDLGMTVIYSHVKTECTASGIRCPGFGVTADGDPASWGGNQSKGVWSGLIRAQRNF